MIFCREKCPLELKHKESVKGTSGEDDEAHQLDPRVRSTYGIARVSTFAIKNVPAKGGSKYVGVGICRGCKKPDHKQTLP